MSNHLKRVLALLLVLVMVLGLLPTVAFAAEDNAPETADEVVEVVTPEHEAELQADVFDDISSLLSGLSKRSSSLKREAFYEAADDVKEIVLASDTYVEGSLVESGSGFYWQTTTGITCGYFPEHEYDMAVMRANNASSETKNATASACTNYVSSAAGDDDVCLVGPMYSEDTSFTEQYGNEARDIAAELGGTAYKLTNKNATVTNIADAISKCRVVIFDSHGNTDWGYFEGGSDGEGEADCVTKANTSYLCLSSGSGITNADMQYVTKVNSNSYASTFCHAYKDSSGNYLIDGTAIANHMTKNAPNSMLWMAICLGMATPGMEQPLRNKGVAVVYGYSQSVSFSGEYEYEEDFWDQMIAGKTVAEAASYMKSRNGNWDPAYSNYSLSRARSNYVAFPIVVSDQDTYPGQRTSSTYDGTVDAVQTVRSTWKLKEDLPQDPCTITLKAGTSTWRTVNTTTNTSASLPSYTGTVPTGYTFAGWTASQISGTTQTAPTLYNGSYATGSNTAITLYACFSKTEGSGGSSAPGYYLATSVPEVGDEIIIALKSGDKYYALPNAKLGSAVTSLAGTELTVSGNKATATSDNTFNVYADTNGNVGLQSTANDTAFLAFNSGKLHCNGWGDTKYCSFSAESNGLFLITAVSNDRALGVSGTGFTCTSSRSSASPVYIFAYTEGGSSSTTTYTTTLTVCSHTYQETDRLDATCTEAGTIEYTCSKCGDTYFDDIPALGHSYGAFTSNSNGTHSKICSRCSDKVTEDCSYTPTTSGTITTYTCSVCNYSYQATKDTYTVSFRVPGFEGDIAPASVIEGNSITLPTVSTVDGYTFAGWVKNAINSETATAPTVLTGSYKPTANVTLYALYTRTEAGTGSGSSGDYVKVTKTSDLTDGQYLIVYEDGEVALDSSLATIDAVEDTIDVTISNNTIPSNNTTDAAAFTFTASNGAFLGTNGKYIGHTGTSNTLNTSTSAMSNTVSIDSDSNAVIDAGGSYVLRYNNASGQYRFRFYKGTQQPIQLYKKGAGSASTTYYTTNPVPAVVCAHNNMETIAAIAATCETAGNNAYYHCPDCGKYFKDAAGSTETTATAETIAALGHDYSTTATQLDATNHKYVCSRCDAYLTEAHSFTETTEGATVTHLCSACGYSYETTLNTYTVTYCVPGFESVIAPVSVIEGNSITLPTVGTVDGYTFAGWTTAAIDSETTTAPTVLTGSYQPTANVTLYALYTRIEAGTGSGAEGYYLATETPAVGDEIIIAIKNGSNWYCLPNGNTSGVYSITADELTVTNGRAVDTEDNTYVVAENKGYTGIKSTTGDYYLALNSGKLAMNGWGDTKPIAFTAGTESGTYYIIGAKSGTSGNEGRALDYSGSVFSCDGEDGGSPVYIFVYTEGGAGDTTYYTTSPVITAPCAHANTSVVGEVSATCTAAGYTGDTVCSDCGITVAAGEVIPALGHDIITDAAVPATCTATGLTAGEHCSRCDYEVAQTVIAALGHDRITDAAVAATCEASGLTAGYHCSRCDNDTLAQTIIPALGHDLSWDGHVGDGTNHVLACSRCEYTENEACTMVDGTCTICGYTEAAEVVVKINSAALRLGENIDLIYTASVPEDATNVYMTFTMNGETVTVEDDGTHTFAFTAINPQCMGDNVAAKLYATVSSTEYSDEIATYSVRQYCINKLADSSVTGTLRKLISDVLAYGAAAQTYMSYNTGAMVNTGSDIANPTYSTFSSISGFAPSFNGTAANDVRWVGAGLTLTDNVAMTFRFYAESVEGLTVTVAVGGRTETFTASDFVAVDGKANTYEISFKGIKANEFADSVTASFARNGAAIGNSVSYSVNAYVCAKQADGNANLAALVKALYNYGAAAKAYIPA